ncbi:MAG TPA: FAD-dependent oxidoreductase [Candidatus Ruania gallistercoris]|uniref:FAD-dependent oxidoreductase n=1 Tax=Candidatus Ruania gallistercoris TaxID=2838746 RepID=A0A9D2EHI9_9MICO|nr:FAD-dependent oxidoreductase [Candidatus Ruania gallistercoris]
MSVDVAVIGGGMAGLVAARTAARAGARVVVLEAASTVGGLVGAHRVAGLDLDAGAESFATRGGHVAALAAELDLPVVTPRSAPARVLHSGRLHPLPATGVLGIPTDLDAPGLVDLLGAGGLARAREDLTLPVQPATAELTLAELVTSRMGPAVLDALVRPIVRGVHSAEPEQIGADALLPGIAGRMASTGSLTEALRQVRAAAPAGSAVAGIDGGVHRLPAALAADATARGAHLRTETPVRDLRRTGGAWQLAGDGWELTARQVVLACPPHTWSFLSDGLPSLAEAGRAWPAPQTADLLTLVLRAGVLPEHERAGTLVAEPGQGAKALTYASAKWDWVARAAGTSREVLRLSYAGGILTGDNLLEFGLRDAARLTGSPGPWPAAAVEGLARTSLHPPAPAWATSSARKPVQMAAGALDGLHLTGAWWCGTGLAAVTAHAANLSQSLTS